MSFRPVIAIRVSKSNERSVRIWGRTLFTVLAFCCFAMPALMLFGATDNVERFRASSLPVDDSELVAWYQEHGARWVAIERLAASELQVEFRSRGLLRLAQPPLAELGYGQRAYLLGYERRVLPSRAVLPLAVAVLLSLGISWHLRLRRVRLPEPGCA